MKENGWVCETYDEFRQHYPVPEMKKAGYVNPYNQHTVTFQEQEEYMQNLWNNMRNAIVSRDGVFYPAVDIRNLKVKAFFDNYKCNTYDSIGNLSTIYQDGATPEEAEQNKQFIIDAINEAPDEVFQALGELKDYYDGDKTYGEVIRHHENL